MVDTDDWPRPSEEKLPEMYDDIDAMLGTAEEKLRSHFTVRGEETERVDFAAATPDWGGARRCSPGKRLTDYPIAI